MDECSALVDAYMRLTTDIETLRERMTVAKAKRAGLRAALARRKYDLSRLSETASDDNYAEEYYENEDEVTV